MTERPRLVVEKVLAFKSEEVLYIIQTTAQKKKWTIINKEQDDSRKRVTVRFSQPADEYTFEVYREEPRAISSSLQIPQTRLTVWAQSADADENGMRELAEALYIAFLRVGG